MSLYLPGSPGK